MKTAIRKPTAWEKEHLTKHPPNSFDEMAADMLKCEQTKGQSVYQHGQSVRTHFSELIHALKHDDEEILSKWRIPKWLFDYKDCILNNLHSDGKIELYTLYHDCGKSYCRYVDKKMGTVHFPNHAEVSRYIWACVGGNEIVGNLIADDMVIHTATAEEIDRKLNEDWNVEDAITLLITALAELHSNAKMFGGIESSSFKGKWKKVERRGNQILKRFSESMWIKCHGDLS